MEEETDFFTPDIMGSGAAFFDFDGDDDLDILLIRGHSSDGGASDSATNVLLQQDENGDFVDVSKSVGLDKAGYGIGCAVGDIDNDGDLDFYISSYGLGQLWLNNLTDGTFSEISDKAGIVNECWGTACCFFDYDQDGWLDLLIVNYLDYYPNSRCEDGSGRSDFCGPASFSGVVDKLYRNLTGEGNGVRFADVTVEVGLTAKASRGLGAICRDFNGDLRQDIFVANDMEANQLWIQQADGTFRDEALLHGIAYNGLGQAEASMGIASGDFNNDGYFDLFLTHLLGETNTLYLGQESGGFIEGTAQSGLGLPGLEFTGFGVVAFDIENDGDLDLAIVNGRVRRGRSHEHSGTKNFWDNYSEPNLLMLNDGAGRFSNISDQSGLFTQRVETSRALLAGDIDNDGDLDLLTTNVAGKMRMYRNDFPKKGNSLMLRLIDPKLRRDAIGAQITVETQDQKFRRELVCSSSYLSSHNLRVHFGLGNAQNYERISVVWPDGDLEVFPGGDCNRFLTLRKGEGESQPKSN